MEIEHSPVLDDALERGDDPHQRMRRALSRVLESRNLDSEIRERLLCGLPRRWERLGDLVLLPQTAFIGGGWDAILDSEPQEVWEAVAAALKSKKLGRQQSIMSGPLRRSQAELLLGEDGRVQHKENGLLYCFDATSVMFSSGNVSERIRMARMSTRGETVLDLFAGIGYYTLPLLVHGGVEHLHACEMNPESAVDLRRNLATNGVTDRCTVHEGDNQQILDASGIEGSIDRVLLGLLPDSSAAWPLALSALKGEGGWLHVHGNAISGGESRWVADVLDELAGLSEESGRRRGFDLDHLERVKSYAPRVTHCVADIRAF